MNDPLQNAKFGIWMGWFFKVPQIWGKIWLKFKKILEKSGDFAQNLAKNWTDWYMNGLLFLEKLVFVWVYFQIPWRHIPTNTKLEYPPGTEQTNKHTNATLPISWKFSEDETDVYKILE